MGSQVTKSQERWFRIALGLSKTHNSYGNYSMVCLGVKGGNIVGTGYNYYRYRRTGKSPFRREHSGLHAEVHFLQKNISKSCTLYIAGVVRKTGHPVLSLPCPACRSAIVQEGFRRVVFWDGEEIASLSYTDFCNL